ncbi:MAG: hypothetical protein K2V71_00705 [Methylotenera sp.]|nr:hypothetical protein [Methylotenera sp.]
MENFLLLPLKILLGFIAGIIGYNFLRWLVDKVSFGKATEKFDASKKHWMLGQFGQLIFVVGFLALINFIAYFSRQL